MRSLAGFIAFALLAAGAPASAEEAGQQIPPRPSVLTFQSAAAAAARAEVMATVERAAAAKADAAALLLVATSVADEMSAVPPPLPITLVLKADLRTQRVTVIEHGKIKHTWPISSGRSGYATRTGTFRPQWTSRIWYSRQYEFAPMPYAVFFNRGTAFHGTAAVSRLGQPASHGCIRLASDHAAQLYKLVHKHGLWQTKIIVQGGAREHIADRTGEQRKAERGRADRRANRYAAAAFPPPYGARNGTGNRRISRYGAPGLANPWRY